MVHPVDGANRRDSGKQLYLADVRNWAMLMLTTLKSVPNTADKLTLLQQVDKMKIQTDLDEQSLVAYAATLAYLSMKGANLVLGIDRGKSLTREVISDVIKSGTIREKFSSDPAHFTLLGDYINLKSKSRGSETLARLSQSGH